MSNNSRLCRYALNEYVRPAEANAVVADCETGGCFRAAHCLRHRLCHKNHGEFEVAGSVGILCGFTINPVDLNAHKTPDLFDISAGRLHDFLSNLTIVDDPKNDGGAGFSDIRRVG